MNEIKPNKGHLAIRAYCSKCGKMLLQSNMLSKKQLINVWDRSVIQAVQIKCDDCGFKFPNFNIDLKIADLKLHCEYPPEHYIKPKHKEDPTELFLSISKQWIKDHPDIKMPTKQEIMEAVKRQRLNKIEHGEKSADPGSD